MKVIEVIYNWHQAGSVQDRAGAGDDYERATVGENGILSIEEHMAMGDGDKWNYLIKFEDRHSLRVFNPNLVEYNES